MLKKLHHVAYRCNDAQETVDFYTNVLGLKLAMGITAETVPSIQKYEPHIHIFFEMEDGSFIAFFDTASDEPESLDDWAQHLALEISPDSIEDLVGRLKSNAVDYIGPVDHGICDSYYFHDPSGHRLEAAVRKDDPAMWEESAKDAHRLLNEWNDRKATQRQN